MSTPTKPLNTDTIVLVLLKSDDCTVVGRCAQVCKSWNSAATDQNLWQQLYEKDFPYVKDSNSDYYTKYKTQLQKSFVVHVGADDAAFVGYNNFTTPPANTTLTVSAGKGVLRRDLRYPPEKIVPGYTSCAVSIVKNTNNVNPILAKEVLKEFLTLLVNINIRNAQQLEEFQKTPNYQDFQKKMPIKVHYDPSTNSFKVAYFYNSFTNPWDTDNAVRRPLSKESMQHEFLSLDLEKDKKYVYPKKKMLTMSTPFTILKQAIYHALTEIKSGKIGGIHTNPFIYKKDIPKSYISSCYGYAVFGVCGINVSNFDCSQTFGKEWKRAKDAFGLLWTDITFMSLINDSGAVHFKLPPPVAEWIGNDRKGPYLWPALISARGIKDSEIVAKLLGTDSEHDNNWSDVADDDDDGDESD